MVDVVMDLDVLRARAVKEGVDPVSLGQVTAAAQDKKATVIQMILAAWNEEHLK